MVSGGLPAGRDARSEAVDLHANAALVHALLCGGHLLGCYYHWRRQQWLHLALHGIVAGYDALSAVSHWGTVQALLRRA